MPGSGGKQRQGTTATGQSATCRRCAGSRHWKGGTPEGPGNCCCCCCWRGSKALRSSCRWWLWWRRCCCCCFIFRRRELAAMTLVASVLVLSLYSLGVSWCLVLPQPRPAQGAADTPGSWASPHHAASASLAPPPSVASGRASVRVVAASPGFVHARKLHFEVQHPNPGLPAAGEGSHDPAAPQPLTPQLGGSNVQKHHRTLQFSSNSKDGAMDSAGKYTDNTKGHITSNVKGSSSSSSSSYGSSRNKPNGLVRTMHQRKISETASAVYLEDDDDEDDNDDDSDENGDDDDHWGLPPAGEEYREGPREGPQASNSTWRRRLPAAIIIGVKKAGTRALLEFLRIHPNVQAPGPEPHFFDRNYKRGLDWYRQLMPSTREGQLTVEKTPSYFITREVPKRVQAMSKDLKLLVVVRDPVTRAISDYAQAASKRGDGSRMRSFEDMALLDHRLGIVNTSWGAIRIGVYTKHLERWFKYFPRRQFHFVSGEQLIADPAGVLKEVQDFLDLPQFVGERHFYLNATRGFPCLVKSPETHSKPHCLGKTKGRRHPQVDPRVLDRLRAFYRPFNAKLYQMVGRDFGWS